MKTDETQPLKCILNINAIGLTFYYSTVHKLKKSKKNLNDVTMNIEKGATSVLAYLHNEPFSKTLIIAFICEMLEST